MYYNTRVTTQYAHSSRIMRSSAQLFSRYLYYITYVRVCTRYRIIRSSSRENQNNTTRGENRYRRFCMCIEIIAHANDVTIVRVLHCFKTRRSFTGLIVRPSLDKTHIDWKSAYFFIFFYPIPSPPPKMIFFCRTRGDGFMGGVERANILET